MGLLNEIMKLVGPDIIHKGGEVAARHLVRQKRNVILNAYRRAREEGLPEETAVLVACREFIARTL
ncbi:MAG: hypothetical protein PHZ19_11115 [Candidatus Thermoplasmatota archaeon]|nr:hypothetical protein [Candidatus Thermoplasmatota archaeon]